MRSKTFYIRLNWLLPFIFAGITLLAFVLAAQITQHYLQTGQNPAWPLKFWGLLFFSLNLSLGFVLISLALRPVYKFTEQVKNNPALKSKQEKIESQPKNEFEQLSLVFEQVSEALDKAESKTKFPQIIGQSRAIREVFSQILTVSSSDSTVLITGESGTGKELVASALHENSPRKNKSFVRLNCMAIPSDLLENELFGHEKGAFTGAGSLQKGKFEQAQGGTIFLDEIGDMPLETQGKILRVLQEKELQRLGGEKNIRIDVRIIAATNKNLSQLVKKKTFREDLFFRLNVFPIHLPPLRQRREDIPLLADHFLEGTEKSIAEPALQMLISYSWPGNIRQLQNSLQRASLLASNSKIQPEHLPAPINGGLIGEAGNLEGEGKNIDERLALIEKSLIIDALRQSSGVQVKAAQILGIKPRSLLHRIQKYKIEVQKFKQ